MFLRLITDNFTRRPRRKLLTAAALSLGMAVATAALSVSLDLGDRLSQEFRSLGANLVVTPEADSLPLEIGGVDIRPANSGAYLPEADLPKIKSVFWHNNIIAFAPVLEAPLGIQETPPSTGSVVDGRLVASEWVPPTNVSFIGTWAQHSLLLSDGSSFVTGIDKANPWWKVQGRWFVDGANECVVGANLANRLKRGIGSKLTVLEEREGTDVLAEHELAIVGVLESGGSEDDAVVASLPLVQGLTRKPGQYRKLYVSALSKPEDDFARRDPKSMKPDELERWSCSPYVSSIAYSIKQVLPGSDVRVIRRVADGEGKILTRVRTLLWLVTLASLLAAALAVGASSAASVIERRTEIGLMKALGAGSGTVGFLLAAEQLLLAFVGGCIGYSLGLVLARFLGTRIFGVPPEPSLLVLGVILVLAAAVTLLGSALPLRRAARFDPAPILRGE
ncbi:MAG TPA: ABC transporter permease [Candidatus Acidoferrum sp.]|jgi:putative ABC transport system permease protein